jgi:hypothetical protein
MLRRILRRFSTADREGEVCIPSPEVVPRIVQYFRRSLGAPAGEGR